MSSWDGGARGSGEALATGPPAPHPAYWNRPAPPPNAPPPGGVPTAYPGPQGRSHDYRTLGLLKNAGDPHFRHFEYQFLEFVRKCLTTYWGIIQSGRDQVALALWSDIFLHLELDKKAQQDLMLLVHLGEAGRAEANEILWNLLSYWALIPEYRDLSNKASALVREAREYLDRPPADDPARAQWKWSRYWTPRHRHFSPSEVPQRHTVLTGQYGQPLPPPHCWGAPVVNAGPPPEP